MWLRCGENCLAALRRKLFGYVTDITDCLRCGEDNGLGIAPDEQLFCGEGGGGGGVIPAGGGGEK